MNKYKLATYNIQKIVNEIDDYIITKNEKNDDIEFIETIKNKLLDINNNYENNELSYYIDAVDPIIQQRQHEISVNNYRDRPIKLDLKEYVSKIVSKLNYLFRLEKTLNKEEAIELYSNIDYLEKKYRLFLELIDYINQEGINIIPDRILFCAYLRINTDQYLYFLNSPNIGIQNIFNSIEELIITSKMNAGELGTRNNTAIKVNLSYDKVGNSIKPNDIPPIINNAILTSDDIVRKMVKNGYKISNSQNEIENKKVIETTYFEKE